jgi:hypothetical protein
MSVGRYCWLEKAIVNIKDEAERIKKRRIEVQEKLKRVGKYTSIN